MKIETIQLTVMRQNAYLVYDEASKEGIIIDPGSRARILIQEITKNQVSLKAILLTHGHFDHIGAVDEIKDHFNVPVVACADEVLILENPVLNFSSTCLTRPVSIKPDIVLRDSDFFEIQGIKLSCIGTPGHTPGGLCYYSEEEEVLFSGDTLFYENVGRTDMEYSDEKALLQSIKEKLLVLPKSTVVYPGHSQKTTIGHEIKSNTYLG